MASSAGGGVGTVVFSVAGTVSLTTAAGLAFVWLRLRSNSLVAPALAHVATNSLAYLAVVVTVELW